jgi:hypothetical protein
MSTRLREVCRYAGTDVGCSDEAKRIADYVR